MLKIAAERYIKLGKLITQIESLLDRIGKGDEFLVGQHLQAAVGFLKGLKVEYDALCLPEPSQLITQHIQRLSSVQGSHGFYELATVRLLVDDIVIHLKTQVFLYVAPHKAKYYERTSNVLVDKLIKKFPQASEELWHAGNCFATDQYNACVLLSMRAAEIGLRCFARYLKVGPLKA
jgi:hypothetical protein